MIHNGRGGENINGLGQLNLSVSYLFEGHENQNFNENPKFKHIKPSLVHPSILVSFQLFGAINVDMTHCLSKILVGQNNWKKIIHGVSHEGRERCLALNLHLPI
jgi:hypothetical protein